MIMSVNEIILMKLVVLFDTFLSRLNLYSGCASLDYSFIWIALALSEFAAIIIIWTLTPMNGRVCVCSTGTEFL